jgi:precorrin-3B synthase
MTQRGWCPSVFTPMPTGDGLLARVKPPGARLTPEQARALAAAARREGNGAIELTARGNIQVRGLTNASAPAFTRVMIDAGLASIDADVERRRNVLVSPLAAVAAAGIAAELEARVTTDASVAALPPKFAFAVGVPGATADLRLAANKGTWLVWPDGAPLAAVSDDPVADALRVARAFLAVAPDARRMRDVSHEAVFASAGLHPAVPAPSPPPPCVIGPLAHRFGVGLPFGATDADTLAALAAFGTLALTPWRAVILDRRSGHNDGVTGWQAGVASFATSRGLIADPADPRLRIFACVGRPACAAAQSDVRHDAIRFARDFPDGDLHVSGCTKGCAHPAPAAVTLVARAEGYRMVRNGTAAMAAL